MKSTIAAVAIGSALVVCAGPARPVTLDDFLSQVQRTHPLFAREALQTDIEAKRLESIRGREDWELTASPSFTYQEPLETSPFVAERVDYLQLGAGARRAIWKNGSRLSVEWTSDVLDQKIPGFAVPTPGGVVEVPVGPSTFYTHVLRATYSLPIMKNRGGVLDRLDYELAAFDVELSSVKAAENQESFLVDAAGKFLDWVFMEEQLRIGRERLALAEQELERTRKKRSSYLVDEADVLRAEDAVYQTRSAVLLVESRWKAARAELAQLAGWPDDADDTPVFDLYEESERPTLAGVSRDIEATRAVRTIDLQEAQLATLQGGLAESTRPELALNVSGALLGGDDEFAGSLEMTHPDVTVGLELRYPLGNRTANADVEQAHLRERQLELARRDVEVTLSSGMRAIVVELNELSGVLALNRERIETARRKTEEELSLYNQGRGDLTFVIQSRDNEAGAKLAYAEHALLYHKLLLQYSALADRLLPEDTTD